MKKFFCKMNLERFGRIVFKKGETYEFDEKIIEGKIMYSRNTMTGPIEIYERDIRRFFNQCL